MATRTLEPPSAALRLTRERVLEAARAVADAGGLEALTMRKLGRGARRRADGALPPRRQQGAS